MQTLKRRLNISANVDVKIRQDPDLRAAFDFWVRNVYLDRPGISNIATCKSDLKKSGKKCYGGL